MLAVYNAKVLGTAPAFPARMEERITASLLPTNPVPTTDVDGAAVDVFDQRVRHVNTAGESDWLLKNGFPQLIPR